ncbi:hypothetical protein CNEO2_210006 [Clostridium neonatale]|nr:hypothetical protein CNEO2_130074 [Clostridium neonatale]CAI3202820.1 hypothetical protein CNEO2_260074 [Clostridium neonatale]CAI3232230.1 hypothetical protein CNEO2_210006 [Clostridium neonatale]
MEVLSLVDKNRNSIYDILDCVNISDKNSNERGCDQNSLIQQQVLDKQFWNNLFQRI